MSLFVWSNRLAVGPAGRPTSDLRARPLPAARRLSFVSRFCTRSSVFRAFPAAASPDSVSMRLWCCREFCTVFCTEPRATRALEYAGPRGHPPPARGDDSPPFGPRFPPRAALSGDDVRIRLWVTRGLEHWRGRQARVTATSGLSRWVPVLGVPRFLPLTSFPS